MRVAKARYVQRERLFGHHADVDAATATVTYKWTPRYGRIRDLWRFTTTTRVYNGVSAENEGVGDEWRGDKSLM